MPPSRLVRPPTIKETQKRVTADLFAKAARRAEFLKRLEKYRKLAKDDPAMAELVIDGVWEYAVWAPKDK